MSPAYVHDDPANAAEAAALLADTFDRARELAALRRQAGDPGAAGTAPAWLEPSDIAGIHVFEEDGGWACDLTLQSGPPGAPACIGARAPLRDRSAAATFGLAMVCEVVLRHARSVRMPLAIWPLAPVDTAFAYDGQVIPLPRETMDALHACGGRRIGEAYALRRLAEIRRHLLGGAALTPERLGTLDPTEARALHTVCGIAALGGIPGWHGDAPGSGAEGGLAPSVHPAETPPA